MPNETLIAVPIKLDNPRELRLFLAKLVEKLDVVLGYRGDSGYVTSDQFQADLQQFGGQTSTLAERVEQLENAVATAQEQLEQVLAAATVAEIEAVSRTAAATYDQSNVQDIADDVKTVADKVDELIGILTTAGILS